MWSKNMPQECRLICTVREAEEEDPVQEKLLEELQLAQSRRKFSHITASKSWHLHPP